MPIANFGAGTNQIFGIGVQEINGGSQPALYLDEISFSGAPAPAVSLQPGAPTPASASPTINPATVVPFYPELSPMLFIIPGIIIFLAMFFR
jgi:hypothetical protein